MAIIYVANLPSVSLPKSILHEDHQKSHVLQTGFGFVLLRELQ